MRDEYHKKASHYKAGFKHNKQSSEHSGRFYIMCLFKTCLA